MPGSTRVRVYALGPKAVRVPGERGTVAALTEGAGADNFGQLEVHKYAGKYGETWKEQSCFLKMG